MGQFDCAVQGVAVSKLARFARRAHARLGRGFVLVGSDNPKPIYVTHILGAPPLLLAAVFDYDPEHEALLYVTITEISPLVASESTGNTSAFGASDQFGTGSTNWAGGYEASCRTPATSDVATQN